MKKLTRILLVVLTLTVVATSIAACSFSDVTSKITEWIDKAYDYIVTGCVHEGGTATCTEKAICTLCGQPYGKPLGHTPEAIAGVSPTCTESGITEGSRCKVCGEILETQKPLSPLGHSWSEWDVTAATCTTDGARERACASCGVKEEEVLTATGHEFGEWEHTNPASCTSGGLDTRKCTHDGCEVSETRTVEATGHKEVIDTGYAATCEKTGLTDGVHCSVCNEVIVAQQTIPKIQHEYEKTGITNPTCEEQGYTTYTCKHCKDSYTSDYKKPTGTHTWGDWKITKNATCTEEGKKERTCSTCGTKDTLPIAATGHKFGEWKVTTDPTCTKAGEQTRTCQNCNKEKETMPVAATGHKFGGDWVVTTAPTCTEAGEQTRTCQNCKTEKETMPVAATGHDYKKNDKLSKAVSCTENGYDYYGCTHTGCNEHYEIIILASGHKYDDDDDATCNICGDERDIACKHNNKEVLVAKSATCTTDGLTEGLKCKDCGHIITAQTVIKATGHDFESEGGTVVTDPTCTTAGYTTYKCQNDGCTHSYVGNYVSANGHNWNDWAESEAATCTENGEEKRTCKNGDAYETRIVKATGHTYTDNTVKPTCTTAGYNEHTCSCGYSYKDKYEPALGHQVEWTQTKAPTCTEKGEITGTCTREGCTESTGLKYDVAALDHDWQGADCMTNGVCSRCDAVGEKDMTVHHDGCVLDTEWHSDGTYHWHAYTQCGTVVDKVEHSISGWITTDDEQHWKECDCGYTTSTGYHDWENKSDKDFHWEQCKDCGKVRSKESHIWSEWKTDDDKHWKECDCGAKSEEADHTWETKYNDTHHWKECKDCHAKKDEESHFCDYGLCACGYLVPKTLRIESKDDLINFRNRVNNGETFAGWTVYLINDIDLGGEEFGGIGENTVANYPGRAFCGSFNGLEKTVSNFKVTSTSNDGLAAVGFFNTLGEPAEVLKLKISGATIKSTHYAGGIVGYSKNARVGFSSVTYSAITSTPEEIGENWDNGDKVGGIAGYTLYGTIDNCTVSKTTIGGYRDLGGIVGYIQDTSVNYCMLEEGVVINVDNEHDYMEYGYNVDLYDANYYIGEKQFNDINITISDRLVYGNSGTATINYGAAKCTHTNRTHNKQVNATCTATGTEEYYHCNDCGKNFSDEACTSEITDLSTLTIDEDPNAHKFGDWVYEVPATCTKDGTKGHQDCEYCKGHFDYEGNKLDSLTINKLDHVYDKMVTDGYLASAATCTAKATYYHSCSCGAKGTETFESGDFGNHNYVDGICTICGVKTESFNIKATEGTSGTKSLSWVFSNFTFLGEQADSSVAIRTSDSDHYRAYKDSTFTISSNYGQKIQKIVITTGGEYNIASADNVTTSGVTVTCSGTTCTIVVNDGVELTEVALKAIKQFRVSKIEITYTHECSKCVTGATCTQDGECSVCGKTIAGTTTKHNYTSVVTAPTCTEKGYTTYTCSCGDSYTGDDTPALGHKGGTATCKQKAICDTCEKEYGEFGDHKYVDGKCTVCDYVDYSKIFYLVGFLNGADSGCEGDHASFHEEYKFVGGKLTVTFTSDSYVFVKAGNNNDWYLFEKYTTDTTGTLAKGNSEKMFVSAGTTVTFTLVVNDDGTLTLSYVEHIHNYVDGVCESCGAKDLSKIFYLVGFLNGADSGCAGDSASLHEEYKFVGGKLTATFTSDSYVFVKAGNNNDWYMFKDYTTDTTGTLAKGNSEKMFVPAGTTTTFTLVVNDDGTLTLSYHVHSYTPDVTDPTCTEKGYTTYTCSCGDSYTGDETPALGHDYENCECTVCGNNLKTTATVTIADYADNEKWSNGTKYSSVNVDENITVKVSGSSNTGKYYTKGEEWRVYQTESPSIVVTAADGKTIVFVKITYAVDKTGVLTLNGSNISSGTAVEVNGSSVTFGVGNTGTPTNGQVKITAIEVIYVEYDDSVAHECSKNSTATCTEDGKCMICGASVAALGHDYDANDVCTRCSDIKGATIHNFTESGLTSTFFTFTSCNKATNKGSVTYNGLTLTTCLKMESSTNVSFTLAESKTLTLVFGGDTAAAEKNVKIDGIEMKTDSNGILTVVLEAGDHTITKGDGINLFYMFVK